MASIRAQRWGTESYWQDRISRYLSGEHSPQQALTSRIAFVAINAENKQQIVGFIAGHLTRRYQCDAELEWIDTIDQHRRQGIAGALLKTMAAWFEQQKALKVCVDVDPANTVARAFYTRYGAQPLNPHWMVWDDISIISSA